MVIKKKKIVKTWVFITKLLNNIHIEIYYFLGVALWTFPQTHKSMATASKSGFSSNA